MRVNIQKLESILKAAWMLMARETVGSGNQTLAPLMLRLLVLLTLPPPHALQVSLHIKEAQYK